MPEAAPLGFQNVSFAAQGGGKGGGGPGRPARGGAGRGGAGRDLARGGKAPGMEAYIRALLGFLSKHNGVCNVQTKKGTGVTEVRAGGPAWSEPGANPRR